MPTITKIRHYGMEFVPNQNACLVLYGITHVYVILT